MTNRTAVELISVNGELSPLRDARGSVLDHCFLYGDGIFEGLRFSPSGVLFHKEHLARLYRSADVVRIPIPPAKAYEEQLFEAITSSGLSSGYVRVVLSRGCGTLGINPSVCTQPRLIIIVAALSLYPEDRYRSGIDVICAKTRKVPRSCLDGQVKACNYLTHIMATWEFIDSGAEEALMLDCEGYVSEVTVANVFGIKGEQLFTPSLDTNCLDGITRRKVIELASERNLRVEEGKYTVDKFIMADEVFLTGTGAGIMPVSTIAGRPIGRGRIGINTAWLRTTYESRIAEWSTPCRAS